MSFAKFQELCEACYITRTDVGEKYNVNPNKPWASGSDDYRENTRETDAVNILNEIFTEDELDLSELSARINAYQQRLAAKKIEGPVWSTIGNIRAAAAKAAAGAFRKYMSILPEVPQLDPEEIRRQGKPSPYGDMQFPNYFEKPRGRLGNEGMHPADQEAAGMMYDGDVLALLIAREYNIEECMP